MIAGFSISQYQEMLLPSGRTVRVPVTCPTFTRSNIPNTWGYGKKPIIDFKHTPMFPEIGILRLLQAAGWEGAWIDSWRKRYLVSMPGEPACELNTDRLCSVPALKRFAAGLQKFGGGWDIVAWKGDQSIFCEGKWSKKDAIRSTQLRWMEDRLSEGAVPENFLIVEWAFGSQN